MPGASAPKSKNPAARLGSLLAIPGAGERNRTLDLLITNELLYQLSYTGDETGYLNRSVEHVGGSGCQRTITIGRAVRVR